MNTYEHLVAFTIAAFVLNASPGPSLLFVSARGVLQGKAAGALTAVGLATGSAIHAVLAGVGVTAVISNNDFITKLIALVGGLYVIFLGVRAFRESSQSLEFDPSVTVPMRLPKLFAQAMAVEFLNPKTILFYLSILPGIIAAGDYTLWQAILVSMIVPATALPIDLVAGISGGHVSKLSARSPGFSDALSKASATALVAIGSMIIYSNF